MKQYTAERRTVKVLAFALVMALVLPLLPALPSFATAAEVTSIAFEGVDDSLTYGDALSYWIEDIEQEEEQFWSVNNGAAIIDIPGTVSHEGTTYTFTPTAGNFSALGRAKFQFYVQSTLDNVEFICKDEYQTTVDADYNKATGVYSVQLTKLKGKVTITPVKNYSVTIGPVADGITLLDETDNTLKNTTVKSGSSFTFKVQTDDTFPATSTPVVSIRKDGSGGSAVASEKITVGKEDFSEGRTYTIQNADSDYYISVSVQAGYTVSAPSLPNGVHVDPLTKLHKSGAQAQFKVTVDEVDVPKTSTVTVTATAADGSNVALTNDNGDLWSDGCTYTISSVTSNITIKVTVTSGFSVTYSHPNSTLTVAPSSVKRGENLTFKVKPNEGYTITSIDYRYAGGTTGTIPVQDGSTEREYTLSNVSGNVTITVNATLKSYTVTVEVGAGFTTSILKDYTVSHGDRLTFTVTANPGYTVTKVEYTMSPADGSYQQLTLDGSNYSIPSVTGNVTIKVTTNQDKYIITPPTVQTGYSYAKISETEIVYDSKFKFSVTLEAAYSQSTPIVSVKTGTVTERLTPLDSRQGQKFEYEFTVTGNATITVEGVSKNRYTLSYQPAGTGYTASASYTEVTHDGSFVLTLKLEDAYDTSKDKIKVTATMAGTGTVEPEITNDGQIVTLTFNNVTGDVNISRIELTKKSLTVNTPVGDGESKYTVTFDGNATYGEPFTVIVKADAGYKVTSVIIDDAIGAELASLSRGDNNQWKCSSGITEAGTIEVTVAPITVTVKWTNGDKSEQKTYNKDDNPDCFKEAGDNLTFNMPESDKPTRKGFDFDGWTDFTDVDVKNDDIDKTITPNWKVNSDLFKLSTSAEYDAGQHKLIFTTKLEVNDGVDAVAQVEYRAYQAKIVGSGFFYGKASDTLTNETDVRNNILKFLGEKQAEFESLSDTAPDGFDGEVRFFYQKQDGNNFTVNTNDFIARFGGLKQDVSRSGIAWVQVEINDENVFFVGSACRHTPNG